MPPGAAPSSAGSAVDHGAADGAAHGLELPTTELVVVVTVEAVEHEVGHAARGGTTPPVWATIPLAAIALAIASSAIARSPFAITRRTTARLGSGPIAIALACFGTPALAVVSARAIGIALPPLLGAAERLAHVLSFLFA